MNDTKPGVVTVRGGREYKTVALRVHEFRTGHPIADGWAIHTDAVHIDDVVIRFTASIVDPSGRIVAMGHAEEIRGGRGVNSTSALENCETSAIGRALSSAGFAGSEYASADELAAAIHQERAPPPPQEHHKRPPFAGPGIVTERNGQDGHRAAWEKEADRFREALAALGLDWPKVLAATRGKGWRAPSSWSSDDRRRFYADLRDGRITL